MIILLHFFLIPRTLILQNYRAHYLWYKIYGTE